MRGSYRFRVKSKKTLFEFSIKRNITVIKGDSATGKTALLHMLYEYLRVGRESGYVVSTDADYFVYLRKEVGRDWKETLLPLKNTVIFIEENNNFVFGEEFAEFVKTSGNYFVLVNRSPFKMLPYSIHEIYEIVTMGKRTDVKESYHMLKELYSNYPIAENNKLQNVITEDSNAGFQFFEKVFADSFVCSANGKGNIINKMQELGEKDTLVIADGAAFGAMIENCLEYFETKRKNRISIWLPESFEYLILKAGLIQSEKLLDILKAPSDYIECQDYESWERFFTELLISLTNETPYPYSKNSLNPFYLQKGAYPAGPAPFINFLFFFFLFFKSGEKSFFLWRSHDGFAADVLDLSYVDTADNYFCFGFYRKRLKYPVVCQERHYLWSNLGFYYGNLGPAHILRCLLIDHFRKACLF